MSDDLRELLGSTDIYLIDQVLRGRIQPGMSIFDAGCGSGRNLRYFMKAGYETFGCDSNPAAIEAVRAMAAKHAPGDSLDRYRVEALEDCSFDEASMDVVVCNAVLHFASSEQQFAAMLVEAWRLIKPSGVFFSRLASTIGIEERVTPLGGRRFGLPDGSERFLVDEAQLLAETERLEGKLLDPIKSTNVQGLRCMTTWVLQKS